MMIPITLECTAGRTQTFSRSTPNADGTFGGLFAGTETITATVWPADSQAYSLQVSGSPYCIWTNAALTQWAVTLQDSATATLAPGIYRFEVTSTTSTSGETGRLFEGFLEVTSSAGSSSANPPDLITAYYAFKLLSGMTLTVAQQETVPDLITAASSAIRRFCFGRNFDIRTYVEEYDVALDGTVRLYQVPVNIVTRVQAQPSTALTVWNSSTSVQFGQIYFTYTGQFDGSGTNAQTVTGVNLAWTSNGTAYSQAITFTTGMTCSGLATAISAVGSGWTATADSVLGAWPVTEIISGYVGQGVVQGQGAQLMVYSTDLSEARIDNQSTGILWCGRQWPGIGPKWGPDWLAYDQPTATNGKVKITYTAGFTTIPTPVQLACAELVKFQLYRLRTDFLLKSESAAEYSYDLNDKAIMALPPHVQQGLSQYRLHYA